jgi:hypothetical protein
MYDLSFLMSQVRPITGGNDGLGSLVFSQGGRLYSYYRQVLLSAPAPEGFPEFVVAADALVKAATKNSKLSVSPTRLTLTSGKLKTWLPLNTDSVLPESSPTTEFVQMPTGLVATLKELAKFVPSEAPRVWATSLLLHGQYAYATDGQTMMRQRLDVQLPFTVALPKSLITVLVKLNKPITTLSFNGNVLYATFADGSRLSSPVYAEKWPDLTNFFMAQEMSSVHPELIEFISSVKQYAGDGTDVTFEPPNTAKFNVGETEAVATFEANWIQKGFRISLKALSDSIDSQAEMALTDNFLMVKYTDRTYIVATKVK